MEAWSQLPRAIAVALTLAACRRPDPAPSAPPPEDAPEIARGRGEPPPACGPVFAADDAVEVPAGTEASPRAIEAACSEDALAVTWRAGDATGWAVHPLRDGSRWGAGRYELPPGGPPGAVVADRGVAWGATVGRDGALALLRVPPDGAPARLPPADAQTRGWWRPQVAWAEGARALVAVEARAGGRDREVWLVALGGGPAGWATLGPGALATTSAGPRALVVTVVTADRASTLRGRWIDARAALRAMRGGATALAGAVLGAEARVPLAHAGVEFSPRAADDGALLFQYVIGAERGGAWRAAFPREGAAEASPLGMIPSALGDVAWDGAALTLHWWDERYRRRRRTLRGARVVGESDGSPRAANAFAALDAARATRHLACAGAPWVVAVDGGRLRARREDCAGE